MERREKEFSVDYTLLSRELIMDRMVLEDKELIWEVRSLLGISFKPLFE